MYFYCIKKGYHITLSYLKIIIICYILGEILVEKTRICGDIKHPPFEFIDEDGKVTGFNVDISKCIAEEMGMEIDVNLHPWSEAIGKIETGEYDAIQGMSISGNREERFIFAAEYITVFHSAFTLVERNEIRDLSSLGDYKIAVQENDVGYDVIMKMGSGRDFIPILVVSNQEEALKLLLTKQVDIVVGNKLTILYYIEKYGIEKDVKLIGSPLNITKYGIAFNKENTKIAYKFKMGMERLKANGKYETIYNKWFAQNTGYFGKQIIENVETGVIYIDKLGRVTAINNYAIKVLDVSIEKVLFRSLYETKIAEIFNIHMIQRILDKTLDAYYGKVKNQQKNNDYYLEVNYLKLLDDKNDFMGVLLNFKDISERTRLEQTLIRKDKMESLGFLLLNVAHEIRNPLTSIKNFVELIPDNINDEEFRNSLLYHVPKQIDYIDDLVSNLLEYSKPNEARLDRILIEQFIKEEFLESIYKTISKGKDIEFLMEIPDGFVLYADPNQIKQVLINLIQNACDSIKEKGIIKIYASENKDEKTIVIEDDGDQIPESSITKVFDPFFTTKSSGTGLGLFICYQLMKENNGTIEISNIYKGSRVTLIFWNDGRKTKWEKY